MAFRLPNQNTFNSSSKSSNYGSTPIIRKDLEEGVLGEANNDGTIYVSNAVEPNSERERSIVMHEMKHMTDMKLGKLGYTDNEITWNGDKFERADGYIKYQGKWYPEGDKSFPWEQH
tara:strand:- start:198 stop:548 length:351 start_codon:yes stop_codon:yes gene_type:complete